MYCLFNLWEKTALKKATKESRFPQNQGSEILNTKSYPIFICLIHRKYLHLVFFADHNHFLLISPTLKNDINVFLKKHHDYGLAIHWVTRKICKPTPPPPPPSPPPPQKKSVGKVYTSFETSHCVFYAETIVAVSFTFKIFQSTFQASGIKKNQFMLLLINTRLLFEQPFK